MPILSDSSLIIEEGEVYAFRVFDIGSAIDISEAAQILEKQKSLHSYRLRKSTRSILISEHPLVLTLEPFSQVIDGHTYEIQSVAKLWSFGAISIQLIFKIERAFTVDQLCEVAYIFERDDAFHAQVVLQVEKLIVILEPSIEKPSLWERYEDYLVFNIKKAKGIDEDLKRSFLNHSITALILAEKPQKYAPQMLASLEQCIYQYSAHDLVILHWNGALIYDLADAADITLTIEFVLCSLLELRYYDEKLDLQLAALYQKIVKKRPSVFYNPYKEISDKAAIQYIEISEIVDRVGNAFKTLGDYYFATIFRAATQKFYIGDWRKSVDEKLNNLAEVSKLFQGEIDERRNQLMEIVIIILIAFEVMPFLYKLLFP